MTAVFAAMDDFFFARGPFAKVGCVKEITFGSDKILEALFKFIFCEFVVRIEEGDVVSCGDVDTFVSRRGRA